MSRASGPLTILFVSHTHWDREWYHTAVRFRQRLVPLVDELLARAPDEPPFLLDGQTIVLDDYLAVRPAAREVLSAALVRGSLEAGPWYVLADELLPGGEALVRNLLTGRRTLSAFGAAAPPVLYSPDAFGHPAALPLIAAEFGLTLAILWRGLGGPLGPAGDSFRWYAPDESSVLVHHLPPDGYEFGSNLPADREGARARWAGLQDTIAHRARLGAVLLLNGADHHARQLDLPQAVDALRDAAAPAVVRQTGLGEAAELLVDRAQGRELPALRGELRVSFGYTWSLQGTFAVRAGLKRRAVRLERALVRDVEPWLALARDAVGVPSLAVEHTAWKTLLRCHPHDTLCGCSIDAVARAMAARLDAGEDEAEGLRTDALHALAGHDPDAAAGRQSDWRPAVLVRNRAARVRSGVAEIEIVDFVRDVPVGPGSAFATPPVASDRVLGVTGAVPLQLLERREEVERTEPRRRYPDADLVSVRRMAAWVEHVGGYAVLPLALGEAAAAVPPTRAVARRAADGACIAECEHLRMTARPGAPLEMRATDGRVVRRLLEFADHGDAGDTYTPSLLVPVVQRESPEAVEVVHEGPLRAELSARYALQVPAQADGRRRSASVETLPIDVSIIVDAGAPFVRLRVRGTNTARDHRLRCIIDGGTGPGEVWADAAFGSVRRDRSPVPAELTRFEAELPTDPCHRYVSVFGATVGFTVYADAITEYEALPDGRIALTLLRAVGALSRADLPERPGHAGWPADTPEAQCLGPFECEIGVLFHGLRDAETVDRIERTADDVLFPLAGRTVRSLLAVPAPISGVQLEGTGLAFGACKRSDDGEWLVLRCVNLLDADVAGRWVLPEPPRRVHRSRLDERVGAPVVPDGAVIAFVAPPRGVVTLLVR